tara:strand:- start:256 stop:1281 length:1026 start_codon:yes stop_codon:yes gene_type:complete
MEKQGISSEEKLIFTIIGVLLIVLAAVWLWPVKTAPKGVVSNDATFSAPSVAKTEPVQEVNVIPVPDAEVAPVVTQPKSETIASVSPTFDLVRVEEDGSAVIAGVGAPNTDVRLLADGQDLGVVRTDATGAFAFITQLPTREGPMKLDLQTVGGDNQSSTQQVLVVPPRGDEETAPTVVIAQADGDVVVQETASVAPRVQALSLDTINYSADGDVVFAGRGTSDQGVRVYVDNQPVSLGAVDGGNWQFEIPDIKEGIYTVRVDAVDEAGQVVERVESPFQRVIAQMDAGAVTIQPGFTLWRLAELKYGSGDRYVQIFNANRDLIRDPDMIFPGQIFAVPEQ